jgi:hypothetical protein
VGVEIRFFVFFFHFLAEIDGNLQKCTVFRPEFGHLQNQGKNERSKSRVKFRKFFEKFDTDEH